MYNCMFVSALPDPTCNSEKSANGGNKQILLLLLLYGLIIEVKERPPQTKLKWPKCPPCIILSQTTDTTFLSQKIVLSSG